MREGKADGTHLSETKAIALPSKLQLNSGMCLMNNRYLTLLAIASTLVLVSCTSPTKIETNPTDKVTQVKPSADPASQVKSEATKTPNTESIGVLASELQGKPVVVDVFATWCPGCKNIAPTLSELKQEYSGKVNFVVLDVTDKGKLKKTETQAAKLGLTKFLEANKSKTSTVAIINPATGNVLAIFKNNPTKGDYSKILDSALVKS
jgi:thiol-disulfide isomerase/thioredoxin